MAVAQAIEVLPTPPLPVKNRKRGGSCRNFIIVFSMLFSSSHAARSSNRPSPVWRHLLVDQCRSKGTIQPALDNAPRGPLHHRPGSVAAHPRSDEHTYELKSLTPNSY